MQKIVKVQYKADDKDMKFPFVDIGNEIKGRPSLRVWLSTKFVEFIEGVPLIVFPIKNAIIKITEKQNYVIKPEPGKVVHYLYKPCGFMGSSEIDLLTPVLLRVDFNVFSFPDGLTGISNGCLVNLPEYTTLKYRWERTGELYGQPHEGIELVRFDGSEEAHNYCRCNK